MCELDRRATARAGSPLPDGSGRPPTRAHSPTTTTSPPQFSTNGTTGRAKGAMVGGANLRVLLKDISLAWELTAADT